MFRFDPGRENINVKLCKRNSRNDLKGHDRRMSSAYRMIDEVEEKGNWNISFTYKMKRSGPRIEP